MFTSEAHIGRFFSRSGDRETDLHIGSLPIISGGLECMSYASLYMIKWEMDYAPLSLIKFEILK